MVFSSADKEFIFSCFTEKGWRENWSKTSINNVIYREKAQEMCARKKILSMWTKSGTAFFRLFILNLIPRKD
jgi:hypothetical protein